MDRLLSATKSGQKFLLLSPVILFALFLLSLQPSSFTILPINSFGQSFHPLELTIVFIDVGQGDSTLIILPNNKTMLVDGGEKSEADTVASTIKEFRINKIDVIVATHPHADHIGGLTEIINKIPVGQVLDSGQETTTKTFEDYLSAIETRKIPFETVSEGDTISLDSNVSIEVLNPQSPLLSGTGDDLNNNSVVIKITYQNFSILLPGDIGKITEESLLGEEKLNEVDILLAAHHGSKDSNTIAFLSTISPQVVIIYAGENNPYGHPHQETLSRINNVKTIEEVLRTDTNGTIILITDGQQYALKSTKTGKVNYVDLRN
jgi:competence protein ComEC